MPELLDLLEGKARQALPFIRKLVAAGESANAIIDSLKEFDLGFRRQNALQVIAAVREEGNVERFLTLVGNDTILPDEAHALSVTQFDTKFKYIVATGGEDFGVPEAVTVLSDEALTGNQIFDAATGLLTTERYGTFDEGNLGELTLTIDAALRSPGFE